GGQQTRRGRGGKEPRGDGPGEGGAKPAGAPAEPSRMIESNKITLVRRRNDDGAITAMRICENTRRFPRGIRVAPQPTKRPQARAAIKRRHAAVRKLIFVISTLVLFLIPAAILDSTTTSPVASTRPLLTFAATPRTW